MKAALTSKRSFFYSILIVFFLVSRPLFAVEKLPSNIKWITNNSAPVFASSKAVKGGTFRDFIPSFPLTIRSVGPDSNGVFASVISSLNLNLIGLQLNTGEEIPQLATHWAFGNDNKTMYFKLEKKAVWSDGQPVTADDYVYALEFMRSKLIQSPWHNNFFTNDFDKVIKYDDYTIAIVSKMVLPDLLVRSNSLGPLPKHFYGKLDENFVKKYNWKIAPNIGPYYISEIRKGKSITLKRKKNWWGEDLRYFKGRFNVDKVNYTVIREINTVFEYFRKNKLDSFSLTLPLYWHQKAKDIKEYKKGYIHKIWFYTDSREPARGFWLNQDLDIFKDQNVRYAFAHAINMDKLLKGVLRGDYSRLHSGTIGYGEYTNQNIRARKYNIKEVEELMKKSGWKRGKDGIWTKGKTRYSVKVSYSTDHHTQRLVVLKEEAKKAGIELILQRFDSSVAWKTALEKKHEVAWTGFGATYRPQYWQIYHSANAHKPQTVNFTNTDDPEMDQLIDLYRVTLDNKARIDIAKKIQDKVHEIGAFIPSYKIGYFREAYWRWWRFPEVPATKLSDSAFDPLGGGLFWMDKNLKLETQKAMKSGKLFESVTIIDKTFKPED